jgi:hypothetical protein
MPVHADLQPFSAAVDVRETLNRWKLPVSSLLTGFRDGFARDCVLQRRIGNEPVRPRLAEDRLSGPRGSPLKGYISISYEDLAAF